MSTTKTKKTTKKTKVAPKKVSAPKLKKPIAVVQKSKAIVSTPSAVVSKPKVVVKKKAINLDGNFFIAAKEKAEQIIRILKSYNLNPERKGRGDFKYSRISPRSTFLILEFKNPRTAMEMHKVLNTKFNYPTSIEGNVVKYDFKDSARPLDIYSGLTSSIEEVMQIEINPDNIDATISVPGNQPSSDEITKVQNSGDDLKKFHELRDRVLGNEEAEIARLRNIAKRIVGLVRNRFNIDSNRGKNKKGYRSGKITNSDVQSYWMEFPTLSLAQSVAEFLRQEGFVLHQNSREVLVNLHVSPDENKQQKIEENHKFNSVDKLMTELKETVNAARTSHLTIEQIGSKLWDYLQQQNIILLDGNRKISLSTLFSGLQSDFDKEIFTTLIVAEALKS